MSSPQASLAVIEICKCTFSSIFGAAQPNCKKAVPGDPKIVTYKCDCHQNLIGLYLLMNSAQISEYDFLINKGKNPGIISQMDSKFVRDYLIQ